MRVSTKAKKNDDRTAGKERRSAEVMSGLLFIDKVRGDIPLPNFQYQYSGGSERVDWGLGGPGAEGGRGRRRRRGGNGMVGYEGEGRAGTGMC